MTIGAIAAQAGRRPSSIRYYEQIGLLPRPARVSGRRVYGPDTVRTLAVIETGQRAGLTLDEIRDLLSASDGDQGAIERLREVAVRKLPEVRELIERTEIVCEWLEAAAVTGTSGAYWRGSRPGPMTVRAASRPALHSSSGHSTTTPAAAAMSQV